MIMRQGAAQAVRRRFRSLDIYGALPLVYLGRSLVVAGALLASAKGAAASQPFTLATYAKLQHLDALQISPDGAFIIVGWFYMDPANHKPFVPPNMGTFGAFGLSGILAGAGLIFFAYIGFDAVSTAAQETKNPKRDMPVGIIGSLLVCTVLFIAYSFVLTGVVNYRELNVAAPLALALERIPHPLLATAMNLAVLAGLTSVILVMLLGQSRVFFAMSKDGLLPKVFSAVHPERRTPWRCNLLLMFFVASFSAFAPIALVGAMTSIGTLFAFCIVCVGIVVMRRTHPELARPFTTPWVPFLPLAGAFCMSTSLFHAGAVQAIRRHHSSSWSAAHLSAPNRRFEGRSRL